MSKESESTTPPTSKRLAVDVHPLVRPEYIIQEAYRDEGIEDEWWDDIDQSADSKLSLEFAKAWLMVDLKHSGHHRDYRHRIIKRTIEVIIPEFETNDQGQQPTTDHT